MERLSRRPTFFSIIGEISLAMVSNRHYIRPMLSFKLETLFKTIAAMMLVGQFLGLVFCGDSNCPRGDSEENCAALICSLLSKHSVPISQSSCNPNNSCQCFCHFLIDTPKTTLYARPLVATPHHTSEVVHFFSEPIRNIDHPPLA